MRNSAGCSRVQDGHQRRHVITKGNKDQNRTKKKKKSDFFMGCGFPVAYIFVMTL